MSGNFEFQESGKPIFTIKAADDGTVDVVLEDGIKWTEAAQTFWRVVKQYTDKNRLHVSPKRTKSDG